MIIITIKIPLIGQFEYITKIVINKIRCFDHFELDLSSHRNAKKICVISGNNGTGKTTLLRCIAIGLCDKHAVAMILENILGEWFAPNSKNSLIKIELKDKQEKHTIVTKITKDPHKPISVEQELSDDFDRDKMFVCGYGSSRGVEGTNKQTAYKIAKAINTLFDYSQSLLDPELVIRRQAPTQTELKDICEWLTKVLKLGKDSVRLTSKGFRILPIGQRKRSLKQYYPLGAIADGYTAMITLLLDMLGWAFLADLKEQKNKFPGIILVHEIEQHLHPSWQRHVIQSMHKTFPNLQFIVTTNSPLCAAGTADLGKNKCTLLSLTTEKGVSKANFVPLPIGQRADQILTSKVFDLQETRNPKIGNKVVDYYKLLSKSKLKNNEKKKLDSLREHIIINVPEAGQFEKERKIRNELRTLIEKAENLSILKKESGS